MLQRNVGTFLNARSSVAISSGTCWAASSPARADETLSAAAANPTLPAVPTQSPRAVCSRAASHATCPASMAIKFAIRKSQPAQALFSPSKTSSRRPTNRVAFTHPSLFSCLHLLIRRRPSCAARPHRSREPHGVRGDVDLSLVDLSVSIISKTPLDSLGK